MPVNILIDFSYENYVVGAKYLNTCLHNGDNGATVYYEIL